MFCPNLAAKKLYNLKKQNLSNLEPRNLEILKAVFLKWYPSAAQNAVKNCEKKLFMPKIVN